MPELPDIEAYVGAIGRRVIGAELAGIRIGSPFVLRTVSPPVASLAGATVHEVRRMGKRIVFGCDGERFVVMHLMIAGRLAWRKPGAALPRKVGLAAFDFAAGTLLLTEAGSKRRAALHIVEGRDALGAFERGGLEVLGASRAEFAAAVARENRTLKRVLTDPRLFSGIGNAYSDEILHAARLSPFRRTGQLAPDEIDRLHAAAVEILQTWVARLREQAGDGFPEHVTAFRPEMAVHGRYGAACPRCGGAIQRIVYAENEANYCPGCQTEGRLLADRALSQLLRQDWPRTFAELEALKELRR
ncbi:MAG: formamidopyrimidine-DNA glycosylase [Candidatus Schekmanbacteria bacterium]|nr:formamidopyrimidine-DNA glycosylase [Candidatus Schekmanbacteria bacterium]